MTDFCFPSSPIIPIRGRVGGIDFELLVSIHKARLPSSCAHYMLLSNSSRFFACLTSSGNLTRLEASVPTDVMFCANSQFDVEIDVYSLSMDGYISTLHGI